MILTLILNIGTTIGALLIRIISGVIPENTLQENLGEIINFMLQLTAQARNFVYFLCGDTMFIILPIAVTLLIAKYVVLPIVIVLRSIFIKGNE